MLLSQLDYFRVVARQEHISRAAEELHIAQPALSATISRLEKELGIPLFNRQGRNIELNDAGRRLLMHADFLFDKLAELNDALHKTEARLENELTLSVSNSMFLTGWLQKFVLEHPKIQLRQKMLSEEQMIAALLDETIDIALGEFEEELPGIVRKTIVEDEYVITIPEEHRLAKKKQILFEDICTEPIITLPSNTIFKIADRLFAQKDCKPHIVFEGNQRMMAKMVKLNRGLLFASRQMLYMTYRAMKAYPTQEQEYANTIVQSVADLDCHCSLSLCWKADRELSMMAQQFIAAMEQDYPNYQQDAGYLIGKKLDYPIR